PHGEPLLYDKLIDYCNIMGQDERIKDIHIVTNATLLTKIFVDALPKNTVLPVSLSAFTDESAKNIMGKNYNLKLVLSNIEYAAKKLEVVLTPVLINNLNEEDIKRIIIFAKENKLKISIQKFCFNKNGRNPVKEKTWGEFFKELELLQTEADYPLKEELAKLKETKTFPDIVHKNEIIEVDVICKGRKNDFIGLIEKDNYRFACTILGYFSNKKRIKTKVIQGKNNVIVVKCLN
ncbi:MAG: radical SAM protein, partial [Nanoarchaeota archaeon]|nr:radical SAM protein [Nanoarchaeota archaeon]